MSCRALHRFDERMADVFDHQAFALVELDFKRQDDQHSIYVAAQGANAIAPPCPYLRADVINNTMAGTPQGPRQSHIEIRPVNQHDRCRSPLARRVKQLAVSAIELAKPARDFR